MKRAAALIDSGIFRVKAPGTLAVYVAWRLTRWHVAPALFPIARARSRVDRRNVAPLLDSFARFALQGFGTSAPVLPPPHLVVIGAYRYVRNPMYVAVPR